MDNYQDMSENPINLDYMEDPIQYLLDRTKKKDLEKQTDIQQPTATISSPDVNIQAKINQHLRKQPPVDPSFDMQIPKVPISQPDVEQSNMVQKLLEAQQQQKDAMLAAGLSKAASTIGASIAGIKPDYTGGEIVEQAAKLPVENVAAQAKMQQIDTEQKSKLDDLMQNRDYKNPNSTVSQSYRSMFKKILGQDLPETASAFDVAKMSPIFERYMASQESAKNRQTQRDMQLDLLKANINRKQTEADQNQIIGYQSKLTKDKRYLDATKALNILPQMDALVQESIGGNANALAALGSQLPRFLGEVGVLTDQDVRRYLERAGWLNQATDWASKGFTGTLSKRQAKDILELMKKSKQIHENNLNNVGNHYSKLMSRALKMPENETKQLLALDTDIPTSSEQPKLEQEPIKATELTQQSDIVNVISPEGKRGTIPRSKLKEAQTRGFKEI